MSSLPDCFNFIWASHVSWAAKVDDVSDSSRFRITSRNDGMDPVVMALMRGMVTVGDLAKAVKGKALPFRIKLAMQASESKI